MVFHRRAMRTEFVIYGFIIAKRNEITDLYNYQTYYSLQPYRYNVVEIGYFSSNSIIGHQHDRWMELRLALRVQFHAEV
jgi:hypothetical protein